MNDATKNTIVRTRYAPSPTGKLHIGGARTALFNYLLAKHNAGQFILRIEDTDTQRNLPDSELDQETELKYLNIFPDESFSKPGNFGPYRQSQKLDKYLDTAKQLVSEGKAYYCFCSEQELDEARQTALKNNSTPIYSKKCRRLSKEEVEKKLKTHKNYTIRLKTDIQSEYQWEDLIRGSITFPSSAIGDGIIIRSNKIATYNFAVVIDDHDMQINHILRGEEHIANTPFQIAIYHALGWEKEIPKMGHISMIVDDSKRKLSKRNSIDLHFLNTYRTQGYPPNAVLNFLTLLGWSYKEQEIFTQEELIKVFALENISKAQAIFDVQKLQWISHKYFQKMEENYYINFIHQFFDVDLGVNNDKKDSFALLNKNRITHARELNALALDQFSDKTLSPDMIEFLKPNTSLLSLAKEYFPADDAPWDELTIRSYLKQLAELSKLSGAKLFKPLRLAFSFALEGLHLPDIMLLNGKDKTLANLNISIQKTTE